MKNQSRTDSVELIVQLSGVETLGKCRIVWVSHFGIGICFLVGCYRRLGSGRQTLLWDCAN